jgi:NAD(P)-dependent dehydrogenase (short-subunit alcohol dehydrogenase family)
VGRDLLGRRAVVTGGASGIGLASATRLADEGAAVAVLDLRAHAAVEAAERIAARGGLAIAVECDVSDEASVQDAVRRAATWMGGVDALVACAGIARAAETHLSSLHEWETTIAVNLTGVFLSVKHCLPSMIDNGGGTIVTIGSVASLVAAGSSAAYDASKGGVLQLTRNVAAEYASRGIRANCVCAGIVATSLHDHSVGLYGPPGSDEPLRGPSSRVSPPLGRAAEPHEIAAVVSFLCSDDSSFMTGAAVPVDGGYSAI